MTPKRASFIHINMRIALALLLVACSGAPTPPLQAPWALTLNQRARICADHLRAAPSSHEAHACARLARLRQGQRARLDALLSALPASPLKPYFQGRARLGLDLEAAAADFARSPTPYGRFGEALVHTARGALEPALASLAVARASIPEDPEAWALEVRLRVARGQLDQARMLMAGLSQRWPTHPQRHAAAASLAARAGDLEAAYADLDAAIRHAPDDPALLIQRAALSVEEGRIEAALGDLRAAISREADSPQLREAVATALIHAGAPSEALDHLNVRLQGLEARGEAPPPHLCALMAEAYARSETPAQALAWARRAREAAPDHRGAALTQAKALIALKRAAEIAPLEARLYAGPEGLAARLEIVAALSAAGQSEAARAALAATKAAAPDDPRPWRLEAAQLEGRQALQALLDGLNALPQAATLHQDLAARLAASNHLDQAWAAYTRARALAPHPALEAAAAQTRWAQGRHAEALGMWRAALAAPGWTATAQQAAREAYAQALSSQGQHGAAAEALDPLQRARPHDHTLALRRGALRLKAGQAALAVEALKVGLARGGDPAEFMPLLAVASAEAGAPEAARARFEAALAADPTHTPLRFAFAAFLQGIGDRQAALAVLWSLWARDPHDPTTRAALRRLEGPGLRWPPPWPALSLSPDLAPLAARVPPQAPSVVLRDERSLRVDAQGVAVVRLRRAVLLKRPESIARYAEIHVGFNAGRPPRLLRAETLTPDGERLPLASQRVFDPNQRLKQHGDGRQLALVFAGRQPGAVLDYEVEIPRPNPALGGLWWDAYPLGNAEPTLEARYTLTLPEGAPLTLLTPHLGPPQRQRGDGIERLSWAAMDIPPMAKGAGPAVFATSLRGWGELDTWYHGLFAPRSRPTPLIQGLAARLAPPQADRAEIIGRVLAFTEREITYLGVEFGLGAYQPRPPESTLSTRKGDCKDVTALMAALLAARGIIAYPALINPGGPPRLEGFFAPSQFSHVFLYVPPHAGAPALFLDATAKGGTLKAIPAPLRGRGAFIIDGAGGQRVTVPEARAEDQRVAVHLDVTLTQTGGGRVEARARLDGDPAGEARVALRVDPLRLPDHEALLPSSMRAAALEISDLDAPEAPLTLTARYASLDLVSARLDGALELPLIGLLLTPIAARLKGASRRFDLHLRLRSPPTLQPSWAPLRLDLGRGALTARLRERRRAGEITLTLRLIQRADAGDEARAALFKALRLALEGATLRPGPRFQRLDFLKAIAAERPQDARLQILYAHALFERGDFKAIPPILGHVEQLEARLLLAMTHTALGDRPATITALHAALKSPRARPEHALMLAGALREAGDEAGAVEILDAALRRAPDHEGLVLALIRALVAAGATAEARARLDAWTPNTEEGHAARAALRRVLDAAR